MSHLLASRLIFSKVRSALGLGSSLGFWSSAAPVSQDTHEYFLSLDMRIFEIYGGYKSTDESSSGIINISSKNNNNKYPPSPSGMSECSGPHTANTGHSQKIGSAGQTMGGFHSRVDPETGELLIRGRHVMMGYLGEWWF